MVAAYAASAGGESRAATDDTYTMRPAAGDDLVEQREREPHGREVVDAHRRLDDLGREVEHRACASGCPRCSRARRCRRARRTRVRANASSPSRSARSTVHARDSGACTRQRSSTSFELVGAARADADGRAPLRESLRERGADARRRARHQHVLARSSRSVMRGRRVVAASLDRPCRSRPTSALLTDRLVVVTGAAQGIGAAVAGACAALRRRRRASATATPTVSARTAAEVEAAGRHARHRGARRPRRRRGARVGRRRSTASTCSSTTRAADSGPTSSTSTTRARTRSSARTSPASRNFVRASRAADARRRAASIVNITSIEAHRAAPGFAVYSAMKAALVEPHQVARARARRPAHPRELHRARRHPDARHRRRHAGEDAAAGRRPRRRRRGRGDLPRVRLGRASSPARRSTSTAATSPRAAGAAAADGSWVTAGEERRS